MKIKTSFNKYLILSFEKNYDFQTSLIFLCAYSTVKRIYLTGIKTRKWFISNNSYLSLYAL